METGENTRNLCCVVVMPRHFLIFFYILERSCFLFRFRSPIADPKAKGIVCGLTLDTSDKQLALLYLATVQGIAYGTRHIVEHCNAHGHKARINTSFMLY